jgi:polysaccharide biosynthesis protein PslG
LGQCSPSRLGRLEAIAWFIRVGSLVAGILATAGVSHLAASIGSDKTSFLIDDFDGSTTLQGWQFINSAEGGASGGSLTLGPGHHGHGALLAFRLACKETAGCEAAYATALYRPAAPFPKRRDPAIALWIRFPFDVDVLLVTKDTSGQTQRFPIRPTIERSRTEGWGYVVMPLSPNADRDAPPGSPSGIRGRLVEIGIMVQARTRMIVQGSVSFDEVQLLESHQTFRIDAATQVDRLRSRSSNWRPHIGVNIHVLSNNHALDAARAAGFEFVRMDMLWANVERGDRYRFFLYDALLRELDARGIGVLWILDYGHPNHGGSTPRTPSDIAAFARFAGAVATHFKGRNVRYEIWNEPDTTQFWAPAPDASEYALLLREAVKAIRNADPSAKVSSGGVSRIHQEFLSRALDPETAAGLTAIGIHPYPKGRPESVAPELAALRDWVTRTLGEHLEIWDTEWGYSSTDVLREAHSNGHLAAARTLQATLAVRELLIVWAVGLPLAVWYDLSDDGTDAANAEQNFGLLDSDGNEKPAMKALRVLLEATRERRYAGMIQEVPVSIHAMRFDGLTDSLLIVWTEQPRGRRMIEYNRRGLISSTGLMGESVKSKDAASGQSHVEIDAASGPIYLVWAMGSSRKESPSH